MSSLGLSRMTDSIALDSIKASALLAALIALNVVGLVAIVAIAVQ